MAQSPLAKKLLIKPGHKVAVVGAPEGYRYALAPLPDGAELVDQPAAADVVVVFVRNAADVDKAAPAIRAAKPGALWVAYPKGGSRAGTDLNRDILWDLMGKFDLAGVTLVAVDDTWSAMRFRPEDEVGT